MSIDEVGVDEGDVADGAALVDDRLGGGRRRRAGPRPVLVCHHFRADPELSTPENGLSNANWTSHRPNVFINKSLNVKTEFLT